jgi:glycosyltransferase involved in cell wall biosynthesis
MSGSPRPEVSILLPAYDCAATLRECLESVALQSETRFECIVVDDGSRDETREVARSFERRDARFRVVETPHTGIARTLNTGLSHCRASFIARMDADDRMHPDRIALQKRALAERPDWDLVGCHVRLFPRTRLTPGRLAYESWLNSLETPEQIAADAFVECPIAHPSFFARREAMSEGYRERGWPEDYDLVLRWLAAGRKIGMVAQPLLDWRDTPERLSRNAPEYAIDRFTACKAEHLTQGFLANDPSYTLWGYGDTGRVLRRELAQRGRHPSHIVELHPGRLGQRIHGASVVSPDSLRELPREPIVVSVAGTGPRAQIREALAEMGFSEGSDFVCAA